MYQSREEELRMFDGFFPDAYVDSAYDIDFERLYAQGFRSVIFDIDNTLVPHGAPADTRSIALIERLKKLGYGILLLSNNKEPRVAMFNRDVQVEYIFKAGKPGAAGYERAMERLGTDKRNTLFVGDQIFTDVWGAKRLGIPNILVKPMDAREEIQIVLKRRLEAVVLYFYKRSGRKNAY